MSNPTTPFSWQMPTATDLVTDLPADFEVFGQAVATDLADLLGGTTGQYLVKNSGTNMDFTWVTNSGDVSGVTAGTGITVTDPTGPVPTVTNSMATAIDAKGDLVAGTGADAFSRLAIGANNTILTADSAEATGLKWATPAAAGGLTLLSTTTLSGATTTISSISQSYKSLFFVASGISINAAAYVDFRLNAASNCLGQCISSRYSPTVGFLNATAWRIGTGSAGTEQLRPTTTENNISASIYNYTNTTTFKPVIVQGTVIDNTTNAAAPMIVSGVNNSNSAITSIQFSAGASTFTAGTVLLYGVN